MSVVYVAGAYAGAYNKLMTQTYITIAGVHVDVGDTLRTHAHEKINQLKDAHFEHISSVDITFKHEKHLHLSEVLAHSGEISLRVEGEGSDAYQAFDDAIKTMTRRLEKYKGRLRKHRNRRSKIKQMKALPTLQATHNYITESSLDAAPEDPFAEYTPNITHKVVRDIQTLNVDDAVMQMDLLHINCYVFRNPKTSQINVVYRQEEGGPIGWVEPENSNETESASQAA